MARLEGIPLALEHADGTRYRMLETIRDYGREKLKRAGELAVVAERHCEYYFVLAKSANRGLKSGQQPEWMRRMEMRLRVGSIQSVIAVKIAVAMQGFWILTGRLREGRDHIRAMLALPTVHAHEVALGRALYVGAALATVQGDYAEAQRLLERCLLLRRRLSATNPISPLRFPRYR